jgi:hypothetical protein
MLRIIKILQKRQIILLKKNSKCVKYHQVWLILNYLDKNSLNILTNLDLKQKMNSAYLDTVMKERACYLLILHRKNIIYPDLMQSCKNYRIKITTIPCNNNYKSSKFKNLNNNLLINKYYTKKKYKIRIIISLIIKIMIQKKIKYLVNRKIWKIILMIMKLMMNIVFLTDSNLLDLISRSSLKLVAAALCVKKEVFIQEI